ncbi:MAG: hypothetical protein ACREP0_11360, partial [Rhodanobacteraceae bacterium]
FRPVWDTVRITWYTVRRVMHYGHVRRSYRASRDRAPEVYDPARLLDPGGRAPLARRRATRQAHDA